MDTAKAEGVDVFKTSVGLYSRLPITDHGLTVGDIVEISICTDILPLVFVVPEHLFAV